MKHEEKIRKSFLTADTSNRTEEGLWQVTSKLFAQSLIQLSTFSPIQRDTNLLEIIDCNNSPQPISSIFRKTLVSFQTTEPSECVFKSGEPSTQEKSYNYAKAGFFLRKVSISAVKKTHKEEPSAATRVDIAEPSKEQREPVETAEPPQTIHQLIRKDEVENVLEKLAYAFVTAPNKQMNSVSTPQRGSPEQRSKSAVYCSPSNPFPHTSPNTRNKFRKLEMKIKMRGEAKLKTKQLASNFTQGVGAVKSSKGVVDCNDDGDDIVNQYSLGQILGRGAFGKVRLAKNSDDGKEYAIKVLDRDFLASKMGANTPAVAESLLMKEIAIMKKMKHENVLSLYEVIEDPQQNSIYIVTDYMPLGYIGSKQYLKHFGIRQGSVLSEPLLRRHFRECLSGLFYLHNVASVVHLDIKPENILVGDDEIAKFGDFGVSRVFNKKTEWLKQAQGTRCYHAPEAWEADSFKARPLDIWALGITFFQLATGNLPFNSFDLKILKQMITKDEPVYPESMPQSLVNILSRCLTKLPTSRATLQELITHPWITENGERPLPSLEYDKIEVSQEDISKAMTKLRIETNLFAAAAMKKRIYRFKQKSIKEKKAAAEDSELELPVVLRAVSQHVQKLTDQNPL